MLTTEWDLPPLTVIMHPPWVFQDETNISCDRTKWPRYSSDMNSQKGFYRKKLGRKLLEFIYPQKGS